MTTPVYLNALRAFEASARHQSFSAAATELNVTPAAVGQLVRSLEDWLGSPLFQRVSAGAVRLIATEVAQAALPDIRAGFDRLTLGLERLREGSSNGVLTVTVSPAFAAKWLLPRIESFQADWPDTDVRLDTSLKPVDFVAQGVDIGVRYGLGVWPGLTAEKLMEEEIYPVCSPALLKQRERLRVPLDLMKQTLIHDLSMDGYAGFPSWQAWLTKTGVISAANTVKATKTAKTTKGASAPEMRGMRINNSAAVLQAAIDGSGVALARSVMARDDLAAGRLVRLFPEIKFDSVLAYYVVYRADCSGLPKVAAFRDWLHKEAAAV